jgi:putative ABC transport system permease protein
MISLELGPIIRSNSRRRGPFLLVVLELACAFAIMSGLFLSGAWYRRMGEVRAGSHDDELIEVTLQKPVAADSATAASRAALWQARALDLIKAAPGVLAAAPVSTSLLDDRLAFPTSFRAGAEAGPGVPGWTVRAGIALPDVLGFRVIAGTLPAGLPPEQRAGAVVITRSLCTPLFGRAEDAVGQTMVAGDLPGGHVVAVIEDVTMRRPFMQGTLAQAFHFVPAGDEHAARYLIRTTAVGRPQVLTALDSQLSGISVGGVVAIKPFKLESSRHYVITHGVLLMQLLLGINVMMIALLGPLAVTSFLVAERTRQIGVRRALGATRAAIVRYFLVEVALAVALGTALGVGFTFLLFAIMREAFFAIALDARLLALTAGLLWLDGTISALLPALRAARIQPSVAARSV